MLASLPRGAWFGPLAGFPWCSSMQRAKWCGNAVSGRCEQYSSHQFDFVSLGSNTRAITLILIFLAHRWWVRACCRRLCYYMKRKTAWAVASTKNMPAVRTTTSIVNQLPGIQLPSLQQQQQQLCCSDVCAQLCNMRDASIGWVRRMCLVKSYHGRHFFFHGPHPPRTVSVVYGGQSVGWL